LAAIRAGDGLDKTYLLAFLGSIEDAWTTESSGSTFGSINRSHLAARPIPLPPVEEQRRIVAALAERQSTFEATRQAAKAQLVDLDNLESIIVRAAFSGAL
jgi:type I restriction enzyme S subunit